MASSSFNPVLGRELETELNGPQARAVVHGDGPLLVLAGAGSGKTRVITFRIAHLLAVHRVPPYRILAVTFTNKAAAEMRSRLDRIVGADLARELWVGTFHATCARLLRRYHDAVSLARDFVIYDETDQKAVVARVIKALNLDEKRFPPKHMLGCIHGYKQEGLGSADVPVGNFFDEIAVRVYGAYQEHLTKSSAVDFDDLILHVMRLLEDRGSAAGQELRRRFSHVLVDEFQDVNPTQYRLVRGFAHDHRNVCVVGDDDQSIYRWRGADVRIIRGFKHDFEGTEVVKLEENYRSSARIVRSALGVIKPSPHREPKELFTRNADGEAVRIIAVRDEREEAAMVVGIVRDSIARGASPKDTAIFYRIHAQSRVLEEGFRAENIPYQIVGGTRFFDRAEVKDLLAYLRVLANPQSDVDLLRIINVPARGIGQTSVERLASAASAAGLSIHDLLHSSESLGLTGAAQKRVMAFAGMMTSLRAEANILGPRELAERVLDGTGFRAALKAENSAEADARLENLQELLSSIEDYHDECEAAGEQPSLSGYLERVSLVSDVDKLGDAPRVPMMTVHCAKGLEFDQVVVTGMEEDLFPYRSMTVQFDREELEEERRLAYVAFTRARKRLHITHAAARMIFGNTRYSRPSRFLGDMPADAVEQVASPSMAPLPPHAMPAAPLRTAEVRRPTERFLDTTAADPLPPDDDAQLCVGREVSHPRFGRGNVRSIDQSNSPPVVTVFFPGWGEKRIVATFLKPC